MNKVKNRDFDAALRHFTGPLAAPIASEANGFVATTFSNSTWPDLQINFASSHAGFDGGTSFKDYLGISDEVTSSTEFKI